MRPARLYPGANYAEAKVKWGGLMRIRKEDMEVAHAGSSCEKLGCQAGVEGRFERGLLCDWFKMRASGAGLMHKGRTQKEGRGCNLGQLNPSL